MKVSIIGTGYVGLVSGVCFAEFGHEVTCIDLDQRKIDMLKDGKSPIYEPGLIDLLTRNIKSNRIKFSTDYSSIKNAQVIFLAVGTPSDEDGSADLKYLESAAESCAKEISDEAIIVIKSTVPVGTSVELRELIKKVTSKKFYLVNNPEFLKEGSAINDFMRPDRVIIGHQSDWAASQLGELYSPIVRQGNPVLYMSNLSAEMSKYAANCFLATKISFINEIARLCEKTGADIEEVRDGIKSDERIGRHFLYPGPGYGGSCFPKDVKALGITAKKHGMNLEIIDATEKVNKEQKIFMFHKIKNHFKGELTGKTFAFWGVAFKANTDDIRDASSIDMARKLAGAGANVRFYDPVAGENFDQLMKENSFTKDSCIMVNDKYECLENCDGLVIMTEWSEFKNPNFELIKEKLNTAAIFDARNLFSTKKVLSHEMDYFAVGKLIK